MPSNQNSVSRFVAKLLFAFILGVFILGAIQSTAHAAGKTCPPVKVMTRNLYLGADIFEVVKTPNPQLIPLAVAEKYALVVQNDFEARAKAIAREIAEREPDLVGLQEISCFTRFRSPAEGVFIPFEQLNYLEILQKAMADCGLDYEVAADNPNASITLPMLAGLDAGGTPSFDYVNYSDADVILAKKGIKTARAHLRHYTDNYEVSLAGQSIVFSRGFAAVDACVRGKTYRFVNTHVENRDLAAGSVGDIQRSQVEELVRYLQRENLPVILAGDFNLRPEDAGYGIITAAGFTDLWAVRHNARKKQGFTCCQDEDLLNEESSLDERVDYIFARGSADRRTHGAPHWPVFVLLTGNDADEDKTEAGLWPSDHAGVLAIFSCP